MKKIILAFLILTAIKSNSMAPPPWENPLKIATSTNGTIFSTPVIFQDSAGVPNMIRWKGDTLVCVFQWFRQPVGSSTWDKVAVKFSYDLGLTWTQPVPIIVTGLPVNYQRPFDPTLAVINNDSLRIYFSSSNGLPAGNDSIIDTYSAVSINGVDFNFETNPRFNHPTNRVIDPAVIYFNGNWQYLAPIGAPQDGAYHCTSNDGINFIQQINYISDFQHNWTGNFMINDPGELRFYGSGSQIWFNTSSDGFNWSGYTNTNLTGGDPSVIRTGLSSYLAVYVGPPYITGIQEPEISSEDLIVYPNPSENYICINITSLNNAEYFIYSLAGELELSGICPLNKLISIDELSRGIYILKLKNNGLIREIKIAKY